MDNVIIEKVFDVSSHMWDKNSQYNGLYINAVLRKFDDTLHVRGYVFLRDIYEQLGLKITNESCILGWVKNNIRNKDVEFVNMTIFPIEGTSNFKLVFDCYPILDYLEHDEGVVAE